MSYGGHHHGGHSGSRNANYNDGWNTNYGPGPNMGPPNMHFQGEPHMQPPNMNHYNRTPQMGPPNVNNPGPPQQWNTNMYDSRPTNVRRKSLLIGINYTGSQHALRGCQQDVANMEQFLVSRGYPADPRSMVILTDARSGPFYPSGHNILAAMDWLVSEPGCCLFLHYSGHGGQVKDPDGDRDSGYDDTIVPVDFEQNGQLDSDTLHRHLVSRLPPTSTLFVIFDCCHSGSAIELPYMYRSGADGRVDLVEDVKQGVNLMYAASHLMQGGFSMGKVSEARALMTGAKSFFNNLKNMGQPQEEGLGEEHFQEDWKSENKHVFMYSGCKDDQTSSDASIDGSNVGAMSWAFLKVMNGYPSLSYLQVLLQTRGLLQGHYAQIPQLSTGYMLDLNQPLKI